MVGFHQGSTMNQIFGIGRYPILLVTLVLGTALIYLHLILSCISNLQDVSFSVPFTFSISFFFSQYRLTKVFFCFILSYFRSVKTHPLRDTSSYDNPGTSGWFSNHYTSPDSLCPSSDDLNRRKIHSAAFGRSSSDGSYLEETSPISSRIGYHESIHPSWDDRSIDTSSFRYSSYSRDSDHPSWNESPMSWCQYSSTGSSSGGAHQEVSRSWTGEVRGGMTATMLDSLPVSVIDGYMRDSKRMLVSDEDVLKELMEPLNRPQVVEKEMGDNSYVQNGSKMVEDKSECDRMKHEEVRNDQMKLCDSTQDGTIQVQDTHQFSNDSFILKEGPSLKSFQVPTPVLNTSPVARGSSQFRKLKRQLDTLMATRSSLSPTGFLLRLTNLTELYPTCGIPWLELSSAQHSEGDLEGAVDTLTTALSYLPTNETLLEKRIKLAERLRNSMIVIESTLQLLSLNTTRGIRSGIEGIMTLAKMNHPICSLSLFTEVINSETPLDPSALLDYVRFVGKVRGWREGESELWKLKAKQPDYCPIWFYQLQIEEQKRTGFWNGKNVRDRCLSPFFDELMKEAENCVTGELLWKVYCNAAQAEVRSYTHIRTIRRQHGVSMEE